MAKEFSADDVAQHNKEGNAYIIIEDGVYDISKFAALHPGGKGVILGVAGQDATEQFWQFHNKSILKKYEKHLRIGTVAGKAKQQAPKAQNTGEQQQKNAAAQQINQQAKRQQSQQSQSASAAPSSAPEFYGEMVPYGDPSSYQGWHSAYMQPHHKRFRTAVREWIDEEITPHCSTWDERKQMDKTIWKKCADAGILAAFAASKWYPEYVGDKIAGGLRPEQFDAFCEYIAIDEASRCGSGGAVWGLFEGLQIGLPPVLHFGTREQRDKYAAPCLRGEKVICLAITEPAAGSDVSGLQCTAKLTEDKKHYIVNGEKKWITNGIYSDYFTTAVRTGGPGQGGISLLLIERGEGVTTRQMQCQGMWASGTTYVEFNQVKVPVENLIGKVNQGFKPIMTNFNHERWGISAQAIRFSRVLLEESMRYSHKRKTFGKRLIDHPVIRLKLAHMARQVESSQNYIESITYQMTTMTKEEQIKYLAGPIALLKAQATVTMEFCAREAAQIYGGLAYTRGGQGEKVERLYREVRAYAIPAGSEEIMLDLGIKQGIKAVGGKI